MDSSHVLPRFGRNNQQEEEEAREKLKQEMRWEIKTLIGCSAALLIFFCLLLFCFTYSFLFIPSLSPLILYNLIKSILCGIRLYKSLNNITETEDLKDMIESLFEILTIIGIIVKFYYDYIDCTFIMAPIVLTIIIRIVISRGIYNEFNNIYKIVRNIYNLNSVEVV